MRELIDSDPLTGINCYIETIGDGTKFKIVHEADESFIKPLLDHTARLRNNTDYKRAGIKKSWMHAAEIPAFVQTKWLTEEGIDVMNPDHWTRVREKLNSPDYAYLKAIDGRV